VTRSDPAYDYFRADAQAQGYTVLADYFRDYGIVPPANYGRPAYKDREVTAGDNLDHIANKPASYTIDKSWGEPGKTMWVAG